MKTYAVCPLGGPLGGAPSASLDYLQAWGAPAHPRAPAPQLGSSRRPRHLASGRPKVEDASPFGTAQELAQLRSEGQPVPANTYVALRHKSSQTNLCSDTCSLRNQYGVEFEVSGFTDVEVCKAEWGVRNSQGVGQSNHWAFTTAAPPAAPPA